jgi:3-isopropylmalate/(R)-2-methylmalate dehydratase small subunit
MNPVSTVRSRPIIIPRANIDTDQIIPARFLTTTSREGLRAGLFAGWRYDSSGQSIPDAPFNHPDHQGRSILIAGHNFGCGSSREHAPWALLDYGIRAIISTGFADIFRANATRNGLLPVVVDPAAHTRLIANPDLELTIDLPTRSLCASDGFSARFPFDDFAAHCLIHGIDDLGYLLTHVSAIQAFEESHS